MAWLAITLPADADTADALADALLDAGALSVAVDDADAGTPEEAAQFAEPGLEAPRAWRRNLLTALFEAEAPVGRLVEQAAHACGLGETPSYSSATIADRDWVRATQAQFEPIRVADNLWVVPSWCVPPDPAAINITIDPGLAFGTGSHATTRLMLRWLARTFAAGEDNARSARRCWSVLDYGCGSGILAIVAAKLGAREVIGVDIDPQALVAARDNAQKNGVAARFCAPDALPDQLADIVVANILANPLVVLAPLITAHCARSIALSGILETQADEVMRAYAPHFALTIADGDDGWLLITGERR